MWLLMGDVVETMLGRVVGRKGLNVACRVHRAMIAMVLMDASSTGCGRSIGPDRAGGSALRRLSFEI